MPQDLILAPACLKLNFYDAAGVNKPPGSNAAPKEGPSSTMEGVKSPQQSTENIALSYITFLSGGVDRLAGVLQSDLPSAHQPETPAPLEPASSTGGGKILTNVLINQEVRSSYNQKVSEAYEAFKPKFAEFHNNEQCFGESLAREAVQVRDAIKVAHQGETSWLGQVVIKARNLWKYGTWGNPNYEHLAHRGKNPEEIAYSAFKTDGRDLGLAHNELGDIIDLWGRIKDFNPYIYPENISWDVLRHVKREHKLDGYYDNKAVAHTVEKYICSAIPAPVPSINIRI